MDHKWNSSPPSGSITCMLCRGSVPFDKSETQHFRSHLQHHHGVFYHHEILISVNVLSKAYLIKIVQEYEKSGDKSEMVGEEDMEEVVELEEAVETVSYKSSVVMPSRKTELAKVHNCKTCDAKFGELRDLIEHVNEHNDQEKKDEDIAEKKRQALEMERRRLMEEKKVIKQQKEREKRRLDEKKVTIQREIEMRRQAEQAMFAAEENRKQEVDNRNKEMEEINARNRKDVERSRGLAEIREGLKQIKETNDMVGGSVITEKTKTLEYSSPAIDSKSNSVVFECPECPYTAKRNIELKLHKLSHTGEKRFACEHCDEKFYLDRQLKRHALKHTQEFDKKLNLNKGTAPDEIKMDSSLPLKPSIVETNHQSQSKTQDSNLFKQKGKKYRTESAQDQIMNVLSEDSNQEDLRIKSRASLARISDVAVDSEYFQKFPNQIKKGSAEDERFDMQDQTMPEGWKYRELNRPNGRIDKEYSSPDFMVFRSRKAMVEYMRCMGNYSQEEIEKAEKGV